MRLLVCGGRDYSDLVAVSAELDRWADEYPDLVIICGYDPDDERFQGADELAYKWAMARGLPVFPFAAQWRKFGRAAGPRRNSRMLECGKPERIVPFPGGAGTADMVRKAKAAGIEPTLPHGPRWNHL